VRDALSIVFIPETKNVYCFVTIVLTYVHFALDLKPEALNLLKKFINYVQWFVTFVRQNVKNMQLIMIRAKSAQKRVKNVPRFAEF
jgi:hypothetical protein